jgi:predicted DNA-binding transcriptional regulator YafY
MSERTDQVMTQLGENYEEKIVCIDYTNHQGVRRERRIIPVFLHYGSTDWHKERQWFMTGYCMEKHELRDFAVKDIHTFGPCKKQELKELSPEEYEAKKAAGKKITFAEDPKPQ